MVLALNMNLNFTIKPVQVQGTTDMDCEGILESLDHTFTDSAAPCFLNELDVLTRGRSC